MKTRGIELRREEKKRGLLIARKRKCCSVIPATCLLLAAILYLANRDRYHVIGVHINATEEFNTACFITEERHQQIRDWIKERNRTRLEKIIREKDADCWIKHLTFPANPGRMNCLDTSCPS